MTINSLSMTFTAPAPAALTPTQAEQNRALSEAIRLVNNSSSTPDRQFSLSLDPGTKMVIAKVVDSTTGQVIDQVPSEDILRLAAYLEAQSSEKLAAAQQQSLQKILA